MTLAAQPFTPRLLEPGLAVATLALTVVGQQGIPTMWALWLIDAMILGGAALSGRFPRAAALIVVVGIGIKLGTPPAMASLSPLAVFVNVFSAIGRRDRWWVPISIVLGIVGYLAIGIHFEQFRPNLISALTYAIFLGLAIAGGFLWRAASDRLLRQRAEAHADLNDLKLELARDLHDTVAQTLSHVAMQAWMAAGDPNASPELRRTLEQMGSECSDSATDLRQLLSSLRQGQPTPETVLGPLADAQTLAAEVDTQAERLREAGFTVETHVELGSVSAARSVTMAKSLREAANNILKHAPAGSTCRIALVDRGGTLHATITNPVGARQVSRKGFGVVGMEERLRLLNGTLHVGVRDGVWVTTLTLPGGAPVAAPT